MHAAHHLLLRTEPTKKKKNKKKVTRTNEKRANSALDGASMSERLIDARARARAIFENGISFESYRAH